MNFAGPLRRLYAFIIDLGLIFIVIYTVAPISGDAMFSKEAAPQDLFFFFGYFVIPTTIWGRTPGKWVAGIVVVDSDGRTPGPAAIPREMIGRFVSAIALGLGLAWMVFDPKRQGWHDKIAGTFVVDNPYSGGPQFLRDFFKLGEKTDDDGESGDDQTPDPDQTTDKKRSLVLPATTSSTIPWDRHQIRKNKESTDGDFSKSSRTDEKKFMDSKNVRGRRRAAAGAWA